MPLKLHDPSTLYSHVVLKDPPTLPALPSLSRHIWDQAFLHQSSAVEPKDQRFQHSADFVDNERLEYVGDAVIYSVVASYLYATFPRLKVAYLSSIRQLLTKNATLAHFAVLYDMHQALIIPKDRQNLRKDVKVQADTFEAYVGAVKIYIGEEAAAKWLQDLIAPYAQQLYNHHKSQQPGSTTKPKKRTGVEAFPPPTKKPFSICGIPLLFWKKQSSPKMQRAGYRTFDDDDTPTIVQASTQTAVVAAPPVAAVESAVQAQPKPKDNVKPAENPQVQDTPFKAINRTEIISRATGPLASPKQNTVVSKPAAIISTPKATPSKPVPPKTNGVVSRQTLGETTNTVNTSTPKPKSLKAFEPLNDIKPILPEGIHASMPKTSTEPSQRYHLLAITDPTKEYYAAVFDADRELIGHALEQKKTAALKQAAVMADNKNLEPKSLEFAFSTKATYLPSKPKASLTAGPGAPTYLAQAFTVKSGSPARLSILSWYSSNAARLWTAVVIVDGIFFCSSKGWEDEKTAIKSACESAIEMLPA